MLPRVQEILTGMERLGYVADRATATAVYLALELGRPLLIEGAAGVGKTEVAKVLAQLQGTELVRLQCYEGLDATAALYEWNYPRQILHIRLAEAAHAGAEAEEALFSERYLLRRPLLQAITCPDRAPVLLIDEVDRADEEFEAFLLEVLSDFQVTIPELGTIRATHRPHVILTSNRTRNLSDALRRRCLYLWIDYPDFSKELAVVAARVPGAAPALARQVCAAMQVLRRAHLAKAPGISETVDWVLSLAALHRDHLDAEVLRDSLGAVLKDPDDLARARGPWLELLLQAAGKGVEGGPVEWERAAAMLAAVALPAAADSPGGVFAPGTIRTHPSRGGQP